MSNQISAYDPKTNLSKLLVEARQGKARQGKHFIIPTHKFYRCSFKPSPSSKTKDDVIHELLLLRRPLKESSIHEFKEIGRR